MDFIIQLRKHHRCSGVHVMEGARGVWEHLRTDQDGLDYISPAYTQTQTHTHTTHAHKQAHAHAHTQHTSTELTDGTTADLRTDRLGKAGFRTMCTLPFPQQGGWSLVEDCQGFWCHQIFLVWGTPSRSPVWTACSRALSMSCYACHTLWAHRQRFSGNHLCARLTQDPSSQMLSSGVQDIARFSHHKSPVFSNIFPIIELIFY